MTDKTTNESPGGIAGVIRQGIVNYMKDVHTALPGKIVEFNSENQTASVQLLIRRIFKGNKPTDLPQLINVIVWQPRAGGFNITFPIKVDDECLVLFSERSLDKWFKMGDMQTPNDFRMHSLSDAICLVGMTSEPKKIENYDTDNFQIRNEDGDQHITLLPNKNVLVKTADTSLEMVNATNTINVISETTNIAAETANITASTKLNIDTPLAEFTNNVKIGSNLEVIGNTILGDTVTSNGIDISDTHTHAGSPTSPNGPITPTGTPE